MVDIQSVAAEIRRGKKKKKKIEEEDRKKLHRAAIIRDLQRSPVSRQSACM